jgi:hypothetical protein
MLRRMTRTMRIWSGWLIALGYFACVLAPGAALALGTGPAPCLDVDLPAAAATTHVHSDGAMHDHAMHAHHHADAGTSSTPHHHDGKPSPGACCAMMCVSALPAALPVIAVPARPISTCAAEVDLSLPGEAPPLLYRPPIRLS